MKREDYLILLAFVFGFIGGLITNIFVASRPQPATYATATMSAKPVIQSNVETWEWIDWRGRKRSITVRREVKGYR